MWWIWIPILPAGCGPEIVFSSTFWIDDNLESGFVVRYTFPFVNLFNTSTPAWKFLISSSTTSSMFTLKGEVSTPEINIKVNKDGFQHDFMEEFSRNAEFPDAAEIIKIDGLRAEYEGGWGLLRPSNTSPYLVMRFEADTKECLNKIRRNFINEILKIDSSLEIPNE